ncbi:MAG TPA: efflux RND transporter periplasmic adaptor subunit, partial [Steroidobacteraceae bacterium]
IVALVIGGGLLLAFRHNDDLVQGMADADDISVAAKITARIAALRVQEGDRVTAGQPLFELTSPEVTAKRRQAAAALDAARAVQSKAREGAREEEIRTALANWRRTEAAAELAQSTLHRLTVLFAQNVVTRQRQEEAQAQANSAVEAVAAARAQYDEALAGARRQDRDAAGAQVRQAEGAVAEVDAAYDEVLGRSPVTGEIEKKLADVGELVPAGYPVFTLVDLDQTWVALYLREDQFRGMRVGRTLQGDIPALGKNGVVFRVYYVSPAGDFATWRATRQSAGYDVKTFEVRVRPVQRIAEFRPGMSVLFRWPQP